jgi:hypothetical protein
MAYGDWASAAGGGAATGAAGGPWGMLIGAGAGLIGNWLTANAANQGQHLSASEYQQSRGDTRQQMMAQFLANLDTQKKQMDLTRAASGLASTQMDPYAQQKSLNGANVRRSFGQNYQPGVGFTGQFDMSALSPEHLKAANDQFQMYTAAAQPNVPITGSPGADQFRQQYLNQQQQQENDLRQQIWALMQNINCQGMDTSSPEYRACQASGTSGFGGSTTPQPGPNPTHSTDASPVVSFLKQRQG